jgi:hypothetical protein
MQHNGFSALRSRSTSPYESANADSALPRTQKVSYAARRHNYLTPLVSLAAVSLLCLIVLFNKSGRVVHTSEAATGHPAEQQQQQLAAQIKQLSSNQTQILALLQRLITSQSNRSSSSTSKQHGSLESPSTRLEGPDSSAPLAADIPAAVAALPRLTSLHNAVLRSSRDFEQHRAVARQLLDKLVHMEAAAAQQVNWRQRVQLCACKCDCAFCYDSVYKQCNYTAGVAE